MSIKDKYWSFALGLAVAIIIVVVLVGCTKNEGIPDKPDRDKDGIKILDSTLIGRAQGCDIYRISRSFGESDLYLSECGRGESSVTSYTKVKVGDRWVERADTNMVVQK